MNNHAIKSGVILGVIFVIITLLMYIIEPTLLAEMWVLGLMLLFFIIAVIFFGIQNRKEIGGYMSFGKAWKYSMQVFIVAGLISTIFNILLFNVIDTELAEIVAYKSVETAEGFMSGLGMPEEQMDEALEKARQDALDQRTVVGSLIGFLWGLIIYAILSLITGAIIKRKEKELEI